MEENDAIGFGQLEGEDVYQLNTRPAKGNRANITSSTTTTSSYLGYKP